MAGLTTAFSSNRMMLDYVEHAYRPATARLRERMGHEAVTARALVDWANRVQAHWQHVRIDEPRLDRDGDAWSFVIPVYLGELAPADVRVDLYADPIHKGGVPDIFPLQRREAISGTLNGFFYTGQVPACRPSSHYTARVVPAHRYAQLPMELPLIHWQR
jgi:starch phosphorylase